jgi:hypothetical protein
MTMADLDTTISNAEESVPLAQDEEAYGKGLWKTQQALRLLGAGQDYHPVQLPHPIGGHYRDDQ